MGVLLMSFALAAVGPYVIQADLQTKAHARVLDMMQSDEGRVVFSDLYNDTTIPPEEKEYLGRLYEIFFALPAHLQSEHKATGKIPSVQEIAGNFGVSREAIDLLLDIMTSEPRMPMLLARNETSGEIEVLDLDTIDEFVREKGSRVKVSGWVGKPVPSFELPTLDGGRIRSTDLRGQCAILFVWLTRCPVCRRITPHMVELERKYGGEEFLILGLNADLALGLDIPDAERQQFLRDQKIPYKVAMLDAATRAALGNGNIFPLLFFLGPDGEISRFVLNYQDLETLDKMVRELISLSK